MYNMSDDMLTHMFAYLCERDLIAVSATCCRSRHIHTTGVGVTVGERSICRSVYCQRRQFVYENVDPCIRFDHIVTITPRVLNVLIFMITYPVLFILSMTALVGYQTPYDRADGVIRRYVMFESHLPCICTERWCKAYHLLTMCVIYTFVLVCEILLVVWFGAMVVPDMTMFQRVEAELIISAFLLYMNTFAYCDLVERVKCSL
jgi:hypothetical protein